MRIVLSRSLSLVCILICIYTASILAQGNITLTQSSNNEVVPDAIYQSDRDLGPTQASQQTRKSMNKDLIYAGSSQWSARTDIELYGNLMYCAMVNGVMIYDISKPAEPSLLAQIYLGKSVICVEISGDKLYLGYADGDIAIYGLSDPLSPNILGEHISNLGGVAAVTIWNDLAFVGQSSYGMEIVDIAQSENPFRIGTYPTQGHAPHGFNVIGDTVFAAAGRLWAFDVSLPSAPDSIACFEVPQYAWDIQVIDSLAYVAGQSDVQPPLYSEFSIFNISDLTNPVLLSSFKLYGNIYSFEVVDSLAYVAAGESGVVILDINNPENITPIGCFGGTGITRQVVKYNNLVFCNNYRPPIIEIMPMGYYDICADSFIPEIDSFGDLVILDVSNPASPSEVSRAENPDLTTSVSLYNDLVVSSSDMYGGIALSRSNEPGNLEFVSMTQIPGNPQAAIMRGNYIYVAALYEGLIIVDVTDIEHPLPIGQYDTPGNAMDVALSGNYAIVADGPAGLSVIDVSDPKNPDFVSTYNTSGFGLEVEVSGNHVFFSDREGGLRIFDISDPYNPLLISTYPKVGDGWSRTYLALYGDIIGLSVANAKVEFLNISNPEEPQLTSEYNCLYTMYGLAMNSDYAIVANSWNGVDVVDIKDIQNPVSVAGYNTPFVAYDVAANQDYLFVADYFSLLRFFPPSVSDIENQEDNILGLPTVIELYPNFPNLFNASTVIEFYIPKRSQVTLEIFNTLGQSVSKLVNSILEPGLHQVHYIPTEGGDKLSSGIYVYNLRVGEEALSRQMVLLR